MLELEAPTPLNGDILRNDLELAGIPSDVLLIGTTLALPSLNESHRAQVEQLVGAHPAKAQAEATRVATQSANEATIRERADSALATNTTFLDLASPTNAQLAAQVKALTRQNNGLIRLVLRRFDATD